MRKGRRRPDPKPEKEKEKEKEKERKGRRWPEPAKEKEPTMCTVWRRWACRGRLARGGREAAEAEKAVAPQMRDGKRKKDLGLWQYTSWFPDFTKRL